MRTPAYPLTCRPLLLALDLEFNQPSGTIIQVGAALGDMQTSVIVDKFSALVNPGEPLEPRIAKLCGIREAELTGAGTLEQAYQGLMAWLAPYEAQRELNPLTWGGEDAHTLCEKVGVPATPFGRRWIDAKTVYVTLCFAQGRAGRGGLAHALTKLGLAFEGKKHNARDDAVNTLRAYFRMLALLRGPAPEA